MNKSRDSCIRKFFSNYNQSCYIDSLFVSLFHSKNSLIDNFVNNLQIKQIYDIEIDDEDLNELNYYASLILSQMQNIYTQLSIYHTDDQLQLCTNIRKNLQNHFNIIKKYYPITNDFANFLNGINNPIDVLKYLYEYVFDMKNITSILSPIDDYQLQKFDFKNFKMFGDHIGFSDINFITMNDFIGVMENINNLYLHSIIINNTGGHYVCYYKCNNNWYYYDDTNMTIFIGDIEKVYNHISEQFDMLPNKEIFLLYLKEPPLVTNSENQSIIQLKKSIDDHFDRLKQLLK